MADGDRHPVGIYRIVVRPKEFVEAHAADWQHYEAAAEAKGVLLQVGSVNPEQRQPVEIDRRTPDGRRWHQAPTYVGPTQCGRPTWEHTIRELLDLCDPCFTSSGAT